MEGTVFWITGLSGAGKTTVGRIVYERLRKKKDNVVFLDGDTLREVIGEDLGYTLEDRHRSGARNARLCRLLASQGMDVICCTISMFEDIRRWSRENNSHYIEVYLEVPLDVLRQRNQKNLYSDSADDVVGIGVGMEEPEHPDIRVTNDGTITPDEIADKVIKKAGNVI